MENENGGHDKNSHDISPPQVEMTEDHLRYVEIQMLIERAYGEMTELQQLRQDDQITPDDHRDRIDELAYRISVWENELNLITKGVNRRGKLSRAIGKLFRKHPPSE